MKKVTLFILFIASVTFTFAGRLRLDDGSVWNMEQFASIDDGICIVDFSGYRSSYRSLTNGWELNYIKFKTPGSFYNAICRSVRTADTVQVGPTDELNLKDSIILKFESFNVIGTGGTARILIDSSEFIKDAKNYRYLNEDWSIDIHAFSKDMNKVLTKRIVRRVKVGNPKVKKYVKFIDKKCEVDISDTTDKDIDGIFKEVSKDFYLSGFERGSEVNSILNYFCSNVIDTSRYTKEFVIKTIDLVISSDGTVTGDDTQSYEKIMKHEVDFR